MPKTLPIVAFAGIARAGKTTAAVALTERLRELGVSVLTLKFADPLYTSLAILGLDKNLTPDPFRIAAQRLGSALRESDEDYFVKQMDAKVRAAYEGPGERPDLVVIDDCRYPNEAEWVCGWGGGIFYVDPGERAETLGLNTNPTYQHESEAMAVNIYDALRGMKEAQDALPDILFKCPPKVLPNDSAYADLRALMRMTADNFARSFKKETTCSVSHQNKSSVPSALPRRSLGSAAPTSSTTPATETKPNTASGSSASGSCETCE